MCARTHDDLSCACHAAASVRSWCGLFLGPTLVAPVCGYLPRSAPLMEPPKGRSQMARPLPFQTTRQEENIGILLNTPFYSEQIRKYCFVSNKF